MIVNKVKVSNIQVPFGQKTEEKVASQTETLKNSDSVCSTVTAEAIKAQNLTNLPNYTFLRDINITALNLNGKLYQLPNGQKCLVAKKEGPTVIKTFFKVGSMNEPDNLRGISHFIEHNLFNGSKTLQPTEFVTKVNQLGGNYNASTGFTTTDYYILSPLHKKDDLGKFIQIHADMISNPTFSAEMIEKERGPVISEIQMLGDNPYNLATNTALRNLFGIKSESADLIGGSVKNIQNVTREDVVNYYKSNYTPQDALTVVIGDVDEKETMNLLSKNFSEFKNQKTIQNYEKLIPINSPIRNDLLSPNAQGTIIQIALAGPKNEENKTAINALLTALAGYQNAKLSDALRDKTRQVAAQTESISNEKNAPIALLFSAVTTENNEEEILKIMYKKIHEMAYIPLTENELSILKNKMKMGLKSASESNMAIASILGANHISKGNFNSIIDSEKNIDALSSTDIMNAAKKYLDLNKASIAVVHPQKNSNISFAGKSKENVKVYLTKNNAQIAAQNVPNSKLYSIQYRFSNDIVPPQTPIPMILRFMLEKGSSLQDEKTFSNIEDENNITSAITTTKGGILYSFSFPKESLNSVLENIGKRLDFPPLTRENFEKAKAEIKEQFMSAPKSADDRAVEALYEGTPFASSLRKTLEEIDSVKFEDVENYYKHFMRNPKLCVSLTGDLSDNEILNQVYYNISGQKTVFAADKSIEYNGIKDLSENKIITEVQDRNQADIVQLYRIKRTGNVKDNVAIALLNEVLGGNSNSRLFNDLREKQKLAYKVRSYTVNEAPNEGYLALNISTTTDGTDNPSQAENLKKAIEGFKIHVNKLITEKISNEELNAAKLQIKSKLQFEKESTAGKNHILSAAMNTPYKTHYENEFMSALENTTSEDIMRIAEHYLTKPSAISIIASDATIKANEAYLKGLGNYRSY